MIDTTLIDKLTELENYTRKMEIKEKIKQIESDDSTTDEHILYQLLELAMSVTGRGEVSDDYTKFIEFDIGEITLFSDPYYGNVQIDEQDLSSEEFKILIKEIKKRLLQFEEKIKNIRVQATLEIFDKPLKT